MFLDLAPVLGSQSGALIHFSPGPLALPSGGPTFPSALDTSEVSFGTYALLVASSTTSLLPA